MKEGKILKHLVYSQEVHKLHGGVVPELASRSHLEKLQKLTIGLFENENLDPSNIDVFTATCGPGLIGSLLVGSTFAKSLSIGFNKPFVPMNHLEGHVLSTSYNNRIAYPHLVLLLTGGHTHTYLMKNNKSVDLLGESLDDAIGEVFDKVAKLIGLPYPGGAEIEKCALDGDKYSYILPQPLTNEKNFNFSFSGLKTHINLMIKKEKINDRFVKNLCASFQNNISQILIKKLETTIQILKENNLSINSISVVGGVSNNAYIKNSIEKYIASKKIEVYYPIKEMMSDNAAMIAWACHTNFRKEKANIFFKEMPKMKIKNYL
tara:strand:- start:7678 stop:8637 length:960 start_codon:yes stop_codon:yes gene_type:complete